MLSWILLRSGYLILWIVYGKEEFSKRTFGYRAVLGLSAVVILWLLCILFIAAGIANKDTALCWTIIILVPVIITIWSASTRRKIRMEIKREERIKNTPLFKGQDLSDM